MIWRKGRAGQIYLSKEYQNWKKEADGILISKCLNRGRTPIEGRFSAQIYVRDGVRGDLDNFAKPILDWAQRAGVIEDDKHMRSLNISYGDIGNDVRLIVKKL